MISDKVNVLEDGIIFKFVEDISGGSFDNKTNWGFELKDKIDDMKRPRWAIALKTGPKVKYVKENDYILIENLQWTMALHYESDKFWKTNESRVLLVTEEKPNITL